MSLFSLSSLSALSLSSRFALSHLSFNSSQPKILCLVFRGCRHEAPCDQPREGGLRPRQGAIKTCQERSIIIGGAYKYWLQSTFSLILTRILKLCQLLFCILRSKLSKGPEISPHALLGKNFSNHQCRGISIDPGFSAKTFWMLIHNLQKLLPIIILFSRC